MYFTPAWLGTRIGKITALIKQDFKNIHLEIQLALSQRKVTAFRNLQSVCYQEENNGRNAVEIQNFAHAVIFSLCLP